MLGAAPEPASGAIPVRRLGPGDCREHLAGLKAAESPFWDEVTERLWLVDMHAPALLCLDPADGRLASWSMPSTIGSFALTDAGDALVALRDGVYRLDLARGGLSPFARPEPERPHNRLNDGKASPEGRFWIGSMNEADPRRPDAALYRIDPDGRCTRVIDGLYTSNGLAWSPDGRRMYHSDSRGELLKVYDYDPESGALAGGRLVARLADDDGRPDGGAVDAEGCYWSAGASAGTLNRFDDRGQLIERYLMPVAAPSMVCFGGPDYGRIFVTTLSSRGEAGRVISFAAPAPGLPGHRFASALRVPAPV